MDLPTKLIRHFLDCQEIVNAETWKIVRPIIDEVERQGEEVLLFPPVEGTFWTEWLVKPSEGIPTELYRHLMLLVQLARFSELNLVLVERCEGMPNELKRQIFTEHYRAGRIRYDWRPFRNVMQRIAGEEETQQADPYLDYGIEELARFPLKKKIKPKAIAERILLEAIKIHKGKQPCIRSVNAPKEKQGLAKGNLSF